MHTSSDDILAGSQHITCVEARNLLSAIDSRLDQLKYPTQFEPTTQLLRSALGEKSASEVANPGDLSVEWTNLEYKLSYLPALEKISSYFDIPNSVIFAPGQRNDISHCEVFLDAKTVINLDPEPMSIDLLRTLYSHHANIKTVLGLVENFTWNEPIDLILILLPCYDVGRFEYHRLLKKGGFIACNGHDIPDTILHDTQLSYRGSTVNGGLEFFPSEKGSAIMRKVETDRDFYDAKPEFFAQVFSIVYDLTGRTTDVIENYNLLRLKAVEDTLDAIRIDLVPPEIQRALATSRFSCSIRLLDIFKEPDQAVLRTILLDSCPLCLYRKQKNFILPPLSTGSWGPTSRDLALFQSI